jgi:putative ABC transport system permease protein
MRDLLRELNEVIRGFRRTPRFTVLCIGVLGVGIGLSSSMAVAVEAVLLRRLPVRDQDRVVVTWGENLPRNFAHVPLREREWREFAARTRTLEQVAAVDYNGSWPWVMKDGDAAYPVRRGLVSGGFFRSLGTTPVLGRLLELGDDRVGVEPVVVISHAFWLRQFGGDSSIVGRRLTMHASGVTYTIVGVTPPGLDYPARTELWAPIIPATTYGSADTSAAIVDIVGRMRPGVTLEAVRNEITEFFRQPGRAEAVRQTTGVARTLSSIVVGDVRRELTLLALAVALLLLVTCLNVAGLLLMRGMRRGRDVALRMAVGASRARIVRWHVTEGVVLAALGYALGAAIAWAALGGLRIFAPANLPRLDEIRPDLFVALAAASIALFTGVLFSTGPAVAASRTDAAALLRGGGRTASAGRQLRRAREGLVMAQVAAAVVVLSAAALVVRSLEKLRGAELGFAKDNVMILDLAWDFTRVTSYDRSLAIHERLLPRLRAIPGLVSASPILLTPFSGTGGWDIVFVATDRGLEEQKNNPWLNTEVVSPDYFDVFRIPLREGRAFTDADRAGAPRVVVLSEGAARTLWPDGRALGRRLRILSGDDSLTWTVAGIVGETRYRDYRRPRATIYFPHRQPPFPLSVTMLAVRAAANPLSLLPEIRTALAETAPELMVGQAATMDAHLEGPLAQPRFNALLLVAFAGSALLIVAAGLYGVVAYSVRVRATELAIRAAVGARPRELRALVWRSAGTLVGVGLLIGSAIAWFGNRALGSMLYEVSPHDPVALGAVVVALVLVTGLAVLAPTRWASRTSASELLRFE